ncbi:arginase family protein [Brachybacterium alimentarium]|uniref:arginase family protein n=1 Tax=Brachybacterium alimentarium TaxID=47845 RepID=UPI003FD028B8
MTTTPAEIAEHWSGRHDGDGPEHARWHQMMQVMGLHGHDGADEADGPAGEPHVALLGFRSEEGVRRNQGRVGAADGPVALRRALAPLALHGPLARGEVGLHDLGDAETLGEELEAGQAAAAELTARALDRTGSRLTVVLGGGHETAWSSYLGLVGSRKGPGAGTSTGTGAGAGTGTGAVTGTDTRAGTGTGTGTGAAAGAADPGMTSAERRWGVLNLDAHFDLRDEPQPTSGTPFAQMAEAEEAAGRTLHYAVLGIAEPSNTGALFATARRLGVQWWTDEQCLAAGADGIRDVVAQFAADLDVLYLTIDLDVLPAAVAPGVSAPAAYGVPLPLIAAAVQAAASSGKLALLDVVELNPALDIEGRTARAAARLIDDAVRTVVGGSA